MNAKILRWIRIIALILTKVIMEDSEIFLKKDGLDAWYNELIFSQWN